MSAARTAAQPNVLTLTWQLSNASHLSSKVSVGVSRLELFCRTRIASAK